MRLRSGKRSPSESVLRRAATDTSPARRSPFVSIAQAQTNTANSSQYADHGFATLAAGDRVTLSSLEALTGGNISVSAFEKVIQKTFLPLNVREVLLDIGWENFTAGSPPYQTWVNNWFTASDVMGLSNVLYVGQLTTEGFGSPWVDSLISIDPTVATYYSNGTRAAFVSLDNPEVARYLESDLGMLYSYYGTHPSWVGLGTGSSQSNPYYAHGRIGAHHRVLERLDQQLRQLAILQRRRERDRLSSEREARRSLERVSKRAACDSPVLRSCG